MKKRKFFIGFLIAFVIFIGIGSRLIETNFLIIDKYLGDVLYAVMFYLILSFFYRMVAPWKKALIIFGFMMVIELFQLTGISLNFRSSGNFGLEVFSVLLGTEFGWLDILAYSVGILIIFLMDQNYIINLDE